MISAMDIKVFTLLMVLYWSNSEGINWIEEAKKIGQTCKMIERNRFGLCREEDPEKCPPYWSKEKKKENPYECKKKVHWAKSCKDYICYVSQMLN